MRSALRLAAAILVTGLVAAAPASAATCTTSWKGGNGMWNDAASWTGGVPTGASSACIDADGTYTVTAKDTSTTGSLDIGGGSGTQTLIVTGTPNINNGALNLTSQAPDAGVQAHGVIQLSLGDSTGGFIEIQSGTLVNRGLVRSSLTNPMSANGPNRIDGNLDNRGVLALDNPLTGGPGTWTSSGSITIASSATLQLDFDAASSFSQTAGTIADAGNFSQTAGTFTAAGGTQTDNPLNFYDAISLAPSGTGSGRFVLHSYKAKLISDIASGYVVTVAGLPNIAHGLLTLDANRVNRGTIVLGNADSTHGNLDATADGLTNAGSIVSAPTGIPPNVSNGANGIQGSLTNQGTVTLSEDLNVSGNYTQTSGGTLIAVVRKTSTPNAPKANALAISGQAVLAGALALYPTDDYYPVAATGDTVTPVTYAGARTGAFTSVSNPGNLGSGRVFTASYDDAAKAVRATVGSPQPPVNVNKPEIKGPVSKGSTLSTTTGDFTNGPINNFPASAYSFQWKDCDAAGGNCTDTGPNANSYTLTDSDVGHTIRVTVTAHNDAGDGSGTSEKTVVVTGDPPVSTAPPIIYNAPRQVGSRLQASTGTFTNFPSSFSYEWKRCDAAGANCVHAADGDHYDLTVADVGHTIRVTVTAHNGGGDGSATSDPTTVITAATTPTPTATPSPGVVIIGNTIRSGPGAVSVPVTVSQPCNLTATGVQTTRSTRSAGAAKRKPRLRMIPFGPVAASPDRRAAIEVVPRVKAVRRKHDKRPKAHRSATGQISMAVTVSCTPTTGTPTRRTASQPTGAPPATTHVSVPVTPAPAPVVTDDLKPGLWTGTPIAAGQGGATAQFDVTDTGKFVDPSSDGPLHGFSGSWPQQCVPVPANGNIVDAGLGKLTTTRQASVTPSRGWPRTTRIDYQRGGGSGATISASIIATFFAKDHGQVLFRAYNDSAHNGCFIASAVYDVRPGGTSHGLTAGNFAIPAR